jgi:transcriptional regulator with XRE-family HTH domain
MCTQLHERLRLAREQRGLSLTAIAHDKGVREQNLILIERDAFEELPTGLYGRHAIRSYAVAVGLSPDDALAEVQSRLRELEDPMDGLARVRGIDRPPPRRVVDAAVDGEHRRGSSRSVTVAPAWRPQVAALIDGAILTGIDLALLQLTALVAGVRTVELIRFALPSMVLLFVLIACLYYVLLGGIRRATIGARLVQAPEFDDMLDGADVHAVMQRGLRWAVAEGSSLATWVVTTEHARHWFRMLKERWV